MRNKVLAFIAIAAIVLALFFSPPSFSNSLNKKELSVAAASDLRPALAEIAESFEEEKDARVVLTFASSGTLAEQIEGGAPYDIYFSANREYLEELKGKGLLENSLINYARGFVVLAKKRGSSAEINSLDGLLKSEVKVIALANPKHAPYGEAAVEALKNYGMWDKVKEKIVYAENVAQAEQYISTENADAGIIALSLALNNDEISYVILDQALYSPIIQSLGIVKNSKNKEAAAEFIEYLSSEKAREIMKKYGYDAL